MSFISDITLKTFGERQLFPEGPSEEAIEYLEIRHDAKKVAGGNARTFYTKLDVFENLDLNHPALNDPENPVTFHIKPVVRRKGIRALPNVFYNGNTEVHLYEPLFDSETGEVMKTENGDVRFVTRVKGDKEVKEYMNLQCARLSKLTRTLPHNKGLLLFLLNHPCCLNTWNSNYGRRLSPQFYIEFPAIMEMQEELSYARKEAIDTFISDLGTTEPEEVLWAVALLSGIKPNEKAASYKPYKIRRELRDRLERGDDLSAVEQFMEDPREIKAEIEWAWLKYYGNITLQDNTFMMSIKGGDKIALHTSAIQAQEIAKAKHGTLYYQLLKQSGFDPVSEWIKGFEPRVAEEAQEAKAPSTQEADTETSLESNTEAKRKPGRPRKQS